MKQRWLVHTSLYPIIKILHLPKWLTSYYGSNMKMPTVVE